MHARPVSIALVAVALTIASDAAMSEIYKWAEADGSVHYGDTPPAQTKNVRLIGKDSGYVSVVPGLSKEELARLRERDDQLRLQRLEREVEELRARELAREYAQQEVVYSDVYVPVYGYWRPRHDRKFGHEKPRPEHPIAKPSPPHRTPPMEQPIAARTPVLALGRR
ncbi:MAG: DUF4124 domain-containing protein [Vicinamibacterales bacterium]|nr:DUF4124 domain-containing protein [Vicinamibacterales bacterium]